VTKTKILWKIDKSLSRTLNHEPYTKILHKRTKSKGISEIELQEVDSSSKEESSGISGINICDENINV